MASETRRIFIDSRLRNSTSDSNADWNCDLPYELWCPAGTEARVDGLVMSHSWPAIELGKNDKLYLKETVSGGNTFHRMLTVPPGTYSIGTLSAELQAQLRAFHLALAPPAAPLLQARDARALLALRVLCVAERVL